jgi:tetratricopeptide (TPR) repeat protein
MNSLKLISVFLLYSFCSCGQSKTKHKTNPKAVQLSNKIVPLVSHLDNPDSCRLALIYLDSATQIDDSCVLCYSNKLMFLYSLGEFAKAANTTDTLISLRPQAYIFLQQGGILHYKIGDTAIAKNYFEKSLTICNSVLDTMKTDDSNYFLFATAKAINLIMLDEKPKAEQILSTLYKNEKDVQIKKQIALWMKRDKNTIVDMIINPEKYSR